MRVVFTRTLREEVTAEIRRELDEWNVLHEPNSLKDEIAAGITERVLQRLTGVNFIGFSAKSDDVVDRLAEGAGSLEEAGDMGRSDGLGA